MSECDLVYEVVGLSIVVGWDDDATCADDSVFTILYLERPVTALDKRLYAVARGKMCIIRTVPGFTGLDIGDKVRASDGFKINNL